MIIESQVWFDVVPEKAPKRASSEIGKWLHFGDKAVLHSWLPRLNALVEGGQLRAAKMSRKDPRWDTFPHKPCVLCVYTTDDDNEKARAKRVLAREFDIQVSVWKSDAQTMRDWADEGWLRVEAEIGELKRALASGAVPDGPDIRQRLRDLVDRLTKFVANPNSETLTAELQLSKSDAFVADLKRDLSSEKLTLGTILDRLDNLQARIDRISEATAAHPPTSSSVTNDYLFVIMPFDRQHIDTYDTIRRAILKVDTELKVERVDERSATLPIADEMWKSIRRARLIICDLTDERPNVYYELGYAHAVGRPTLCVAKKGTRIHFDVSGFKIVFFDIQRDLESNLVHEIGESLAATQQ